MRIVKRQSSIFASIDGIKKQFNTVDPEIIDKLISFDPTANPEKDSGGKYSKWLITMYQKGKLKETDYGNIADALDSFDKNKNSFEIRDIFKYKDFATFLEAVHDFNNRELTSEEKAKLQKKAFHTAGDKDMKLLAEDGKWQLWTPLTYEGSVKLARYGGEVAKWCTAYSGSRTYYDSYSERGPLYIFINTKNSKQKYQWHAETEQFATFADTVFGSSRFIKFISDKPNFQNYFGIKSINGLTVSQNKIINVDKKISGHIDIPHGVTSIDRGAFSHCTSLKSIIIPDSVTSIGSYAFSHCTSLTNTTIGNSVTSIGYNAFEYCSSLTSITIPDSVTSIGDSAFWGCSSLTSITIPSSMVHIENNIWPRCDSFTAINVSTENAEYSSIDGVLFNKAATLLIQCPEGKSGSYTIPDSVTSIQEGAFNSCDSLTSITIPDSVTGIGSYAFNGCSSLKSVTLPNSVTSIGRNAFANCYSLEHITISNSVTSIESYAFYNCFSLTSITIGNSVTSIGDDAFRGCTSLKTITIPNSVTSIGDGAFWNCPSLITAKMSDSVTSIGRLAFYYCPKLTIYCPENSYSHQYAKRNKLSFELSDSDAIVSL